MGFAREGVWVMGYCGPMDYGMHFPAHQVGGWPGLWVKRGYGLPEVWVKRGLTVISTKVCNSASQRRLESPPSPPHLYLHSIHGLTANFSQN